MRIRKNEYEHIHHSCNEPIHSLQRKLNKTLEIIDTLREEIKLLKLQRVSPSESNRFPDSVYGFAAGMGRVSRDDFSNNFEMGISLEDKSQTNEEVLILYSKDAQPNKDINETQGQGNIPLIKNTEEATENCDYLNVILTNAQYSKRQCVALMGQYDGYHIQKFMRLSRNNGKLDSNVPLRLVGRTTNERGNPYGGVPTIDKTKKHWNILHKYFDSIESISKKLRRLAEKIAKNNTVVVMFSNHGQSELIMNFICSSRNRKLDMSAVLFFATDIETKHLLDGLGVNSFYDERIFGHLSKNAAGSFGDEIFSKMMFAKVTCIHMVSILGYNILFQDADVVWYRDPLQFFHNKSLSNFDILLADDGNPDDPG